MADMHSVDVIIPTYKPGEKFTRILDMLKKQTYPVNRIIIVNTEKKYFDQFVSSGDSMDAGQNVTVQHISKAEFDHGGTRRMAVSLSKADIFICMTDDAVPADENMVEKLVEGLEKQHVAVSYARQLPDAHSTQIECFTRAYNYPERSVVKSQEDLPKLGIKTYFCSNVCAAYWREIYEELGGFVEHTIFNEDMIYAAGAVKAGYRIAYVADACVRHAHNYTNMQQFHRNFDLGVSQAQHPEVFKGVPSEGEGIRMVKKTAAYLRTIGQRRKIVGLYVTSGYKYIGYQLGKHYKRLPEWMVRKFTMNRTYWKMGSDCRKNL